MPIAARLWLTGLAGRPGLRGYLGDQGYDATAAVFDRPMAVALGPGANRPTGTLFIADTGNHRIRRVDLDSPTPGVSTVLGDGVPASGGSGSPALSSPVDTPMGLAVDGFGNLFVSSHETVRVLYPMEDGTVGGASWVQTIYGSPPRDEFPTAVTDCIGGLAVDPVPGDDSGVYVLDACLGFLIRLQRDLIP